MIRICTSSLCTPSVHFSSFLSLSPVFSFWPSYGSLQRGSDQFLWGVLLVHSGHREDCAKMPSMMRWHGHSRKTFKSLAEVWRLSFVHQVLLLHRFTSLFETAATVSMNMCITVAAFGHCFTTCFTRCFCYCYDDKFYPPCGINTIITIITVSKMHCTFFLKNQFYVIVRHETFFQLYISMVTALWGFSVKDAFIC